ncbi:hypothetical protein VTJ04DRAFT_1953 [Mycothermus thermophilus]|uniref:uncharacterized protein n=1 Tax=Humicola insolens TaxID=85995 RepID=UPI0037441919
MQQPPPAHEAAALVISSSSSSSLPASSDNRAGDSIDFSNPLRPVSRDRGHSRGNSSSSKIEFASHSDTPAPDLSPTHLAQPPSNLDGQATPDASALLSSDSRMPFTASQRGSKARSAATAVTTPHRALSPVADQGARIGTRTDRPDRPAESPSSGTTAGAASAPATTRKRSRTIEGTDDAGVDDTGHSKGGHSLRKRARVDYSQEMIDDDLGFHAARADVAGKTVATPSARGRKRKTGSLDDSDDESYDASSGGGNTRQGMDKSPPSRTLPPRRRNTSKKLSADLSNLVDHASDEVQDTILVSVPAGLEESLDSSSGPAGSASREGSHARTPADKRAAPNGLETASTATRDNSSSPGRPDDAPTSAMSPEPVSGGSGPEQQSSIHCRRPSAVLPERPSRSQRTDAEDEQDSHIVPHPSSSATTIHQSIEIHQDLNNQGSTEVIASSVKPLTPALTAVEDSTELQPLHNLPPEPPISRPSSRNGKTSSVPSRFHHLDSIYNAETPYASRLNLTAYESDTVLLPGPYSEWIYPTVPNPVTASRVWTSNTSTPPKTSIDHAAQEVEWDLSRPLKMWQFARMYQKDRYRRKLAGEKLLDKWQYNNELVRQYRIYHGEASATDTDGPAPEAPHITIVSGERAVRLAEERADEEDDENQETGLKESVPDDSAVPTAPPSPAPADEAVAEDAEEQDADEGNAENDTRPATPAEPLEPIEVIRMPKKVYSFPKLRDTADFAAQLEDITDLPTHELYERAAAAVEVLHQYEQEYRELRKMLDDEENAKRRQANDKTIINWENRLRLDDPETYRRHFDDAVKGPPPFEVRGVRAPKPYVDDPCLEHQKSEDRIMAQAYGFKLDTHPARVGKQNPDEQRWEMPENRLRKRTEKGAELAEENVVEGKRTRRPRNLSEQGKDASRSATPGAREPWLNTSQSLRGRWRNARKVNYNMDNYPWPSEKSEEQDSEPTQPAEAAPEPVRTRRGRGRGAAQEADKSSTMPPGFGGDLNRGARSSPAGDGSRPSTASSNDSGETAGSAYSLREKRKRNFALENDPGLETRPKRRATARAKAQQEEMEEPTPPPVEPKKKRGPKKKEPVTQQSLPSSVPSPVSHAPTPPPAQPQPQEQQPPQPQPVPPAKFYNFVPGTTQVEPSNGSGSTTPTQPLVHTFNAAPAFPPGVPPPPPPPPAVKKPLTKIKLTNNGASSSGPTSVTFGGTTPTATSRASTPGSTAGVPASKPAAKRVRNKKGGDGPAAPLSNGDGDMDKPYSEMTKSEKMSWSMRRRWASGEMQGAVEKRRTTLANKKAERAAGKDNANNGSGRASNRAASEATSSGPANPAAAAPAPAATLLALPRGQPTPPPPPPGAAMAATMAPSPAVLQAPQQPAVHQQLPPPPQGFLQQLHPAPYPYALGPPPGTGPSSSAPWAG